MGRSLRPDESYRERIFCHLRVITCGEYPEEFRPGNKKKEKKEIKKEHCE